MDEEEELLYREMNPEDPYYMGDEEETMESQQQVEYTPQRKQTPQGYGGCIGCLALVAISVLLCGILLL